MATTALTHQLGIIIRSSGVVEIPVDFPPVVSLGTQGAQMLFGGTTAIPMKANLTCVSIPTGLEVSTQCIAFAKNNPLHAQDTLLFSL